MNPQGNRVFGGTDLEGKRAQIQRLSTVFAKVKTFHMDIIMKTRPSRVRTPGLRPRCTAIRARDGATCDKPQHDIRQSHRWSTRNTMQPPRKKFELRKTASDMINDARYQRHLLQALRTRTLRPAVEVMLWAYAVGKPIEYVEHSGVMALEEEYRRLSPDELRARALAIAAMLKKDDPDDE